MSTEFDTLDAAAKMAIRRIVERTMQDKRPRAEVLPDGRDIYCYEHPCGGIAWGVCAGKFGINQGRGIWRMANDNRRKAS